MVDVIDQYARFSLPRHWGSGCAAIADGTHVKLRENNLLGSQHIRYGAYGGIAYHHIADSYIAQPNIAYVTAQNYRAKLDIYRPAKDTAAPVVSLTGTASPSPQPATAVLMPTTRLAESASAPPELPGLSAASVWMTSSMTRTVPAERAGSERPSALTTPAVTLPASPSGFPTATTS